MIAPRIFATLGPASLNKTTVGACADLGVNLFRINLSHTALEDVERLIADIQSWTDVPVCLDSEGAQLRNHAVQDGCVTYTQGDELIIPFGQVMGDETQLSFSPIGIAAHFEPGDRIRVDFNFAELEITGKTDTHCTARVISGGLVGSNKAADCNRDLPLDPMTEKDRAAMEIGLRRGLSHFALSFTNRREDVEQMRALVGDASTVICKIESRNGVRNLEDILEEADEILIDRGDLSRQVPIQKIPFLQRRIIATAKARGVPAVVATNLLESMIVSRGPTRAEVNDVVSTLEMGADGLVLAAETAIGSYPVEAVRMIRTLIDEAACWSPNATADDILSSRRAPRSIRRTHANDSVPVAAAE